MGAGPCAWPLLIVGVHLCLLWSSCSSPAPLVQHGGGHLSIEFYREENARPIPPVQIKLTSQGRGMHPVTVGFGRVPSRCPSSPPHAQGRSAEWGPAAGVSCQHPPPPPRGSRKREGAPVSSFSTPTASPLPPSPLPSSTAQAPATVLPLSAPCVVFPTTVGPSSQPGSAHHMLGS